LPIVASSNPKFFIRCYDLPVVLKDRDFNQSSKTAQYAAIVPFSKIPFPASADYA
jgi:hypothetical protein